MHATINQITFTDTDIVDPDDWIPAGEYNPHNVRPWLLHDHGYTLAVVFASNLQDALDAAVDADKLDRYLVTEQEFASDYDSDDERVSFLGNASEMFNIETIRYVELPNPPRSFVAQFNQHQQCGV